MCGRLSSSDRTSLCSASSLGCRHDTARIYCWVPRLRAVAPLLLSADASCRSISPVRGRGAQQQTSRTHSIDGTDGRTDGQTDDARPFHTPFLRPHTMRGCVSKIIAARSIFIPRQMCEQLNGPYTLLVFTSRVPISVALVFLVKLFRVKAVEVNRTIIPKIKKNNDTRKYRISCLRYALLPHSVQPPVP